MLTSGGGAPATPGAAPPAARAALAAVLTDLARSLRDSEPEAARGHAARALELLPPEHEARAELESIGG